MSVQWIEGGIPRTHKIIKTLNNLSRPDNTQIPHSKITPENIKNYKKQNSKNSPQSLKKTIFAKDLMSKPVVCISSQAPLESAGDVFIKKRYRHLPVLDQDGKLIGILSDRDIFKAYLIDQKSKVTLLSCATLSVFTARPQTNIIEVAKVLFENHIGAMPVVDKDYRVLGIVTRSDLLKNLINKSSLETWI